MKEQPITAFPIDMVAPGTEVYHRKGEASLVERSDGRLWLAYGRYRNRRLGGATPIEGDNDKAAIVAVELDDAGRPVGGETVWVPEPELGLNVMAPALRRLPDGRLGMLYSNRISRKEAQRVFVVSGDEGRSWSPPVVIAGGGSAGGADGTAGTGIDAGTAVNGVTGLADMAGGVGKVGEAVEAHEAAAGAGKDAGTSGAGVPGASEKAAGAAVEACGAESGEGAAGTVVSAGSTGDSYVTGCHDRFAVLSDGSLLAPLHCTNDWDRHHLHVRTARSTDGGASWSLSGPIELPPVGSLRGGSAHLNESGCVEPGVVERADGSLLMVLRTAMGTLFCCESADRGASWSPPRSMEVISPQAPAHLSRIPGTDHLLLVWTSDYHPAEPLGGRRHTVSACVSRDGGRSWPHAGRKVLVRDPGRHTDYPSVHYRGDEAWITLRIAEGPAILDGRVGTGLMRVPLAWFYEA